MVGLARRLSSMVFELGGFEFEPRYPSYEVLSLSLDHICFTACNYSHL
jgi:hypothetical protein